MSKTGPLIVNFVAGPGAGKSTSSAHLFALLKWEGVNAELVTEYAKDKTWERSFNTLQNQIYVFGKQLHRTWVLNGQVDVIVTDSPILLSLIYGRDISDNFRGLVVEQFKNMDSKTYFIDRNKPYYNAGRSQTEAEAKLIDQHVLNLLDTYDIDYQRVIGGPDSVPVIKDEIMSILAKRNTTLGNGGTLVGTDSV